jgi:hypothetical protein
MYSRRNKIWILLISIDQKSWFYCPATYLNLHSHHRLKKYYIVTRVILFSLRMRTKGRIME